MGRPTDGGGSRRKAARAVEALLPPRCLHPMMLPGASSSWIRKENFEPPSPRTQTDLSGAVPRPAWDDRYRDELYSPIYGSANLPYRLFPPVSRPLPGSNQEPTGLIDSENYQAADTYATGDPRLPAVAP